MVVSEAEGKRGRRDPAKVLGLLARQTCEMSAPCCGIPCPFSAVLPVGSEGFLLAARGAVSGEFSFTRDTDGVTLVVATGC